MNVLFIKKMFVGFMVFEIPIIRILLLSPAYRNINSRNRYK